MKSNRQNIIRRKYAAASAASSTKKTESSFKPSDEYKTLICNNSYLGKKGYTIPKDLLLPDDAEFLRKDLFVKPVVNGAVYGAAAAEEAAFPVYRENDKKMYVPRFYGINRYGLPPKTDIQPGDSIHLPFEKPLRDYQDKIIGVYTNHVNKSICSDPSLFHGGGGILEVPCGRGKCLGKNTPILMFDGSMKMVQDVQVGDVLMGDDSGPRNVLTLARGKETMYKIIYENGGEYIVNESHILSLKRASDGSVVDISVAEYLAKMGGDNIGEKLFGYRVPVYFSEKPVEIDPYLLGHWLGKNSDVISKQSLEKYNLIDNVHIPYEYKCNSVDIQMKLLSGFIDSCSSISDSSYIITKKNKKLINDIVYLARSIGFKVYTEINVKKNVEYYSVIIYGYIPSIQSAFNFHNDLSNEESMLDDEHRYHIDLTYEITVEKMEEDDYYGFEIDGNRRFVLGDFSVTHNTVMALKIISLLEKKTLILVHKEFLMNQWIERIEEFLPGARVGKIQGPIMDIVGKDIVIGMIQSLYDKEYPINTFCSFGLTIIDEVHRIGSEQFSRTLLKTVTPYMLGISATVDRKDKLTKVLYMFIGNKIYTEKREDDNIVCVRAINYVCSDAGFNEVEYDFRGNPKYSTMITKLCAFGPRSDFIVRVIADLIAENPESQIMILCHNRSLLTYLFESIQYRKIGSVGYYVGGMKQADLQATESMQIVLATYAMAAEALDIKTLSTLVMVTPKTDIVQSVGRILRVKHDNPIVVDIVDYHDIFQNQWKQRKTFYKKCNYRIRQIDSRKYSGMMLDWNEDTTWTRVFEPVNKNICAAEESESSSNVENTPKYGKCMIDTGIFDFDAMDNM